MPNRHAAAKSNSTLSSVFPITRGAPLRSCAIPKLFLVDLATPPYKNVVEVCRVFHTLLYGIENWPMDVSFFIFLRSLQAKIKTNILDPILL